MNYINSSFRCGVYRSKKEIEKEFIKLYRYIEKAPVRGRSYSDMCKFVACKCQGLRLEWGSIVWKNAINVHTPYFLSLDILKCCDGKYRIMGTC